MRQHFVYLVQHFKLFFDISLDDNSEIGEEPTFHRRRGGRRGRGTDSGWCKRRGGTRLGNPFLPIEMSDIPLLLETKQTSLVDLFNNVTPREDSDSNDTVGDCEEEATHSTGLKVFQPFD